MRWVAWLAAVAVALFGFVALQDDVPEGWALAGNNRDAYETEVVDDADRAGAVAHLWAAAPAPEGFGTLMQEVRADDFRGKRVRMTAHVRTADVAGWAGLWLRVDGARQNALAFDNMQDRPITGTSGWAPYSVVLDVPRAASVVAFGTLLHGPGHVFLDDVSFQEVDESVPVTAATATLDVPARPINLDFEG